MMEICESMEIEKHSESMEFLSSPVECEVNVSVRSNNSTSKKHNKITDGKFFKLVPEKSVDAMVASCVKCEPEVVEIRGSSSNNFLSHLRRKHDIEIVEQYKQHIMPIKLSNGKKATPAKTKKTKAVASRTFKTTFLRFVVSSMLPVDTILSPSFYALMESCKISRSELEILNSEFLISELELGYGQNKKMISSELKKVRNVFCTANIWTGCGKRYLTITAHWIDEDMCRKSAAICVQSLRSDFTSNMLRSKLNEVQEAFGLQNAKVATLVGDYSCLFTNALRAFKIDVNDKDDLANDSEYDMTVICLKNETQFSSIVDNRPCPLQMLSAFAVIDIANFISSNKQLNKKHSKVMKKCNILWNHPHSINIFREVLGLTLTKPNANDWTTVYTSLQEILTLRGKCDDIFKALETKSLQDDDFGYIEELLKCTKPLINAVTILQGSEHTLFGSLLSTLLVLRRQLNILISQEWTYCKSILEKIICNVNEKFKNFYSFTTPESTSAALATFSHPEFKNRWLTCVDSGHHAKLLQAFKVAVASELPERDQRVDVATKATKFEHDEFFDFGTEEDVVDSVTSATAAEMQVFNYFSDSSQRLNILERYPQIKQVFLKYNTPLSSFAILDRMFGFNMWTCAMGSNRLTSHINVEMAILLKANRYYE